MDIQAVEKLAKLVSQSSLYEVSINDGQETIRIKNAQHNKGNHTSTAPTLPSNAPQSVTRQTNQNNLICSKHIGWLRLAQDTLAQPLINVGDTVSEGQTLAYVGVLGKLEPVISDKAGQVVAVLAENEQIVEYGTPLFELA